MEIHEQALKRFNQVVSKKEGYNVLVLLEDDGWEELMPEEDCRGFTHSEYPGVVVSWFHGAKYGTTYDKEGTATYFAEV